MLICSILQSGSNKIFSIKINVRYIGNRRLSLKAKILPKFNFTVLNRLSNHMFILLQSDSNKIFSIKVKG